MNMTEKDERTKCMVPQVGTDGISAFTGYYVKMC